MQNVLIQRAKDQFRSLKTLSEELQVQMALGKAEARDVLEEERKTVSKFFRKQLKLIDHQSSVSNDRRLGFLRKVEDLESALNTPVPEGVRAYDKYKSDILNKIYKMEEEIQENVPNFSSTLQNSFEVLKAKMDAYRLNLALHDKDDPERVVRIKNDFVTKLDEIRLILAQNEIDQTKLDQFSEDISSSYKYLKQAIKDLS